MRWSRACWTVAWLAALLACRAEPRGAAPAAPPAAPLASPLAWTAEAPGGDAAVRQEPLPGGCRLSGVVAGASRWTADACAGTREDLHFASRDGERLLVLHPIPGDARGKDWSEATVARILARGREERRFVGAELVGRGVIADMSHELSWMKGVGSGGGIAPRHAPDGEAVVLELVDGTTVRLGFDGSGAPRPRRPTGPARAAATAAALPPAPARALAPPRPEETSLWRWEDADGAVRYTTWAEIPTARRRHAEPVTATVGSVERGRTGGPWRGAAETSPTWAPPPGRRPGPRLNGLTDEERHEQELARLRVEEAKKKAEAAQWERQRDMHRKLERAAAERRWPYGR